MLRTQCKDKDQRLPFCPQIFISVLLYLNKVLLPRKVINLLSYVKTIFSDVNSKAEKNQSLVFWVPPVFCNPFSGAF